MKQAKRPRASAAPSVSISIKRVCDAGYPFAVGALSVVIAACLLGRSLSQWHLPLMYEWDAINVMTIAKTGMERLWASGSDRLGAPGTLDLAYYPMPEYGQLFIIKIISLFAADASETINGYFFATFFLTAAVATWALRRLGVHPAPAALGALTFSLLPCHFWRGSQHMFVNGYYLVPALCYVLLQRSRDESPVVQRRVLITTCALCFFSPLINTYYSFFFSLLLAAMGVFDALAQRNVRPLVRAGALLFAVAAGLVAGMTRSLPLYVSHKLGFVRPPQDSEVYGLKITQMLLPAFATVSSYVQDVDQRYRHSAPLVTENRWNDLGLLAACAFIVTFVATFALAQRSDSDSSRAPHGVILRAGLCNLLCILYGTIGGFSALFSYLVSPLIRSTNRIEVFIAFLCLAAALLLVQHAVMPMLTQPSRQAAALLACALGVALLIWDTAQKDIRPDFARSDAVYTRDAQFFGRLESSLPMGTRIFQLPQVTYPEAGFGEPEYDQFRPYLHTQNLVWSFGAVRSTEAELANRRAEAALMGGQVDVFRAYLAQHNFTGLLLSRKLAAVVRGSHENVLNTNFGAPLARDAIGEFVFYGVNATAP